MHMHTIKDGLDCRRKHSHSSHYLCKNQRSLICRWGQKCSLITYTLSRSLIQFHPCADCMPSMHMVSIVSANWVPNQGLSTKFSFCFWSLLDDKPRISEFMISWTKNFLDRCPKSTWFLSLYDIMNKEFAR